MSTFAELLGKELGPTEWFEIGQSRIDEFARATNDPQWIHTDPARAAEGPFGTTIAHGFLTLSLCVPLMTASLGLTGYRMGINYGVNKVRFPAPVPSGSRVRARQNVSLNQALKKRHSRHTARDGYSLSATTEKTDHGVSSIFLLVHLYRNRPSAPACKVVCHQPALEIGDPRIG